MEKKKCPAGERDQPKKSLGQHYIINPGICPKMVDAAGVDDRTGVLEIGPGRGALTVAIAPRAKKVVAVEVDGDLLPALRGEVAALGNVEVLHGDILNLDLRALIEEHFCGLRTVVMGNLPYYITTPILMKLLESRLPVASVTAMVQREAALRLCAPQGSRDSGAVTMAVRYFSEPRMLFDVSPGSFYPPPKVTSSVIRLDILPQPAACPADESAMFAVIKAAFAQRRKTAANSISAGLSLEKAHVTQALERCGIDPGVRPERLCVGDFARISDELAADGAL